MARSHTPTFEEMMDANVDENGNVEMPVVACERCDQRAATWEPEIACVNGGCPGMMVETDETKTVEWM